MHPSAYESTVSSLNRQLVFTRMTCAGFMVGLLLSLWWGLSQVGNSRVVMTPPVINHAFWVSGREVDQTYLEDQTYYILTLTNDVTPSSVEYQCQIYLKLIWPELWGATSQKCKREQERVAHESIATVFTPTSVSTDLPGLRVSVAGKLSTYISDRHTSDVDKTYVTKFRLSKQGTLYVEYSHETPANDPFGLVPVDDAGLGKP